MTNRWLGCVVACLVAAGGIRAQTTPAQSDDEPAVASAGEAGTDSQPASSPNNGNFWIRAEYLLWKINGASVPALVGRISPEDSELIQQFPNSAITPLFGGGGPGISYDVQSGGRLETGFWLDEARQLGFAVGFFQLAQGQQHFLADSQGQQTIGPVFYRDAAFSEEAILMDGVIGLREGTVSVDANQHLWGTEINAVHSLAPGTLLDHLELLAGVRYLQFSEGLLIRGTSQAIPNGALPCG
jgi:hypothetical protein